MSESLEFFSNGYCVTVTYIKKKYPSKSYSQTFVNIKVTQQEKEEIIYEVDLDDNYIMTHFPNLSLFYRYLKKHKNEDILMYNRCDLVIVKVQMDDSDDTQEEIIQLNNILRVSQEEYQSIVNRGNFYSDVFKTKIIQKIEKSVKNYFKVKSERKDMEKPQKIESIDKSVSFKVQGKNEDFKLSHSHPSIEFNFPCQIHDAEQFLFKIASLKSDKLYVYADYFNTASNTYIGTERFLELGKSYCSSFWIDQGHTLAIQREEDYLTIKNVSSKHGKVFYAPLIKQDNILFKITVTLKEIL